MICPLVGSRSVHPPLIAEGSHPCWLAKALDVGWTRRVWLGRMSQLSAFVRRAGDAFRSVCARLRNHVGTADSADDRQHPGDRDHCPQQRVPDAGRGE